MPAVRLAVPPINALESTSAMLIATATPTPVAPLPVADPSAVVDAAFTDVALISIFPSETIGPLEET